MTVCHFIAFLLLEVAHIARMMTARPKRDTARFALVLSSFSGLAKAPTRITAMTVTAANGIFARSGSMLAKATPVWFHTKCIGLVMMVMGAWKKIRRRVMASHKRKGFSQPVRELSGSLRCRPSEAAHQLSLCDQPRKLISKKCFCRTRRSVSAAKALKC